MPEQCPSSWTLSFPEADIACLSLDTPGERTDLLTVDSLQQLDRQLDGLAARPQLAGLIIASGNPGHFLGGPDVDGLYRLRQVLPAAVSQWIAASQAVLARLAEAPYVSVAAIDGACLSRGAELACWCDRRVATDSRATEFGFPEVQLGLVPGWGATARLPRITSLAAAVELIAIGRSVDAAEAHRIGLADELVSPARLIAAAVAAIRDERQSGQLPARRRRMAGPRAIQAEDVQALDRAGHSIAASGPCQPAALWALRLLRDSVQIDLPAACRQAAAAFQQLLGSPQNLALMNVYLLRRHNRQHAAVAAAPPRPLQRLGIIGAGTMGVGVAAAHIRCGIPVCLADASEEALTRGWGAALEEVAGSPPPPGGKDALAPASLITRANSLECLADCDLVLESVVENAIAKRRLYQELEPVLKPDAVLASNTSTISISSLAKGLQQPEQFCGMHFFNPVSRTQLVEIVRGERTSEDTLAIAIDLVKRIGRMPIVVNDGPGFLVNRLLAPYLNESLELLCAGASIEQIDSAAEQFGMPLGPLALYDLIGIDTSMYAGRTMWEAFPERIAALPVLPAMIRRGRLGQKSGAGFYRYTASSPRPEPDPLVAALLEVYVRRKREFGVGEITERLLLPVVLEATRVLAQGIVRDIRDVDVGMIHALGFPAQRGGLLFWADTLGAAQIVDMLQPYRPLGPRFEPTDLLLEMARQRRTFYDGVPLSDG